MVLEDHGRVGDGVLGEDAAVAPHFQGQLVEVDPLSHTGVLHLEVHLLDGREVGVHRATTPMGRSSVLLVGGGRSPRPPEISTSMSISPSLFRVAMWSSGLRTSTPGSASRSPGLQLPRPLHLEPRVDLVVRVELEPHLLEVQDDFAHVLEHTGNGAELVQDVLRTWPP